MKKNEYLFSREKMEFLISAIDSSLFIRNMKKEERFKSEINILKYWHYFISQNINDDKKTNKIILLKLIEDFEKINSIFLYDISVLEDVYKMENTRNEKYNLENINNYKMLCEFLNVHINIKNKIYLKKKWLLIYLIEDAIELNDDDRELVNDLENFKTKIDKIDYEDNSENNNYYIFEDSLTGLLSENKDIFKPLIEGLSFSKNYLHQLYTEKEWAKIFKKYNNEKALKDDNSSEYMDFIKLNGYIYWINFISNKRPLRLVAN